MHRVFGQVTLDGSAKGEDRLGLGLPPLTRVDTVLDLAQQLPGTIASLFKLRIGPVRDGQRNLLPADADKLPPCLVRLTARGCRRDAQLEPFEGGVGVLVSAGDRRPQLVDGDLGEPDRLRMISSLPGSPWVLCQGVSQRYGGIISPPNNGEKSAKAQGVSCG